MTTSIAPMSDAPSSREGDAVLFYALSLPLLFYYYFGAQRVYTGLIYLAALAVFFRGLLLSGKFRRVQLYVVMALVTLLAISFFTFVSTTPALLAIRLNFGVLVLTLAFAAIRRPDITKLTTFLSAWTVGEYLLLRANPSIIFSLPNYAGSSFSVAQASGIMGGVHSFGGNRSVTAVILLSLFIYLENTRPGRRWRYLPLIACLLCESGTAYALIFVYLLTRFGKRFIPLVTISAVLVFLLYYKSNDLFLVGRFNSVYLVFLWNYKSVQILDYIHKTNLLTFLFGMGSGAFSTESGEVAGYGSTYGDFIFLDFLARFGLSGVAILLTIAIKFGKKHDTRFPIWCLLLGTFHYHVLFSSPGQVIGGYFLAGGRKKKVEAVAVPEIALPRSAAA